MSANQPIAVVTGTSNGFGRLTAETFVRNGYTTYATMRDRSGRNAAAAAELEKVGAHVVELDVTSDASVEGAAKEILAGGAVDVLVNNAGNAYMGVTEAFTAVQATAQFDTNVVGAIRVDRAFLPGMRARKSGLVVYVTSIVGRVVFPFMGIYNASKWALEGLAESHAYELRPFGIDVAIVEPGAYGTNIFATMVAPNDADRVTSYGDVGKIFEQLGAAMGAAAAAADPQDVANAILTLAQTPAGSRPLRTVVGGDPRIAEINALAEERQHALLRDFGLGALLPKDSVPA